MFDFPRRVVASQKMHCFPSLFPSCAFKSQILSSIFDKIENTNVGKHCFKPEYDLQNARSTVKIVLMQSVNKLEFHLTK